MSFTKRDYEAVARIVREVRGGRYSDALPGPESFACGVRYGAEATSKKLSEHFARYNPRFNPERFAKACEPGGGK